MFVCFVRGEDDKQNRTIIKTTIDLNKNVYIVNWLIGNTRLNTPNNLNLFSGIGYKQKTWWSEAMIQRQWSNIGNNLLLDFRFQKQFKNKSTLYIEKSPFLNKQALYHFFIFEKPLVYKFNIGAETENVFKRGQDSIGFGPRISRPLAIIGNTKISMTFSYRFRLYKEPNELRLYLVFNIPIRSVK